MTKLRAAIYTRKSSEEGLDQSFNSLDAQREACEAYITSQKSEGWTAVKSQYDDGGWSGGTMERPALRRLLADVEAGLVDIIVVYKVDRLSRSLADFARMVDLFDKQDVSFVSVTQAFNTTTSMGRLTLNVLLSFAQFEREVTGERIRDKIAASKAKGMWMGGFAPLGYDPKDRTLVINEAEAGIVRHIFRRFLELRSVYALHAELDREGFRTKVNTSRAGNTRGGRPFGRGALAQMLRNRLYRGEIVHKDKCHPGLHEAIVDEGLFGEVQTILARSAIGRRTNRATTAPLAGLLFDALGNRMAATHARGRGGKRYLYYISPLHASHPEADRVLRRVPSSAIEEIVLERLRTWSRRPTAGWEDLLPRLNRIEIHRTAIVAEVQPPPHDSWAVGQLEQCMMGRNGDLRITSPVKVQTRGGRTSRLDGSVRPARGCPDRALIAGLRRAHRELAGRSIDPAHPAAIPASAGGIDDPYMRRLTRLALLAPDIQRAILDGCQPAGLKLADLLLADLPLAWHEQRELLGF